MLPPPVAAAVLAAILFLASICLWRFMLEMIPEKDVFFFLALPLSSLGVPSLRVGVTFAAAAADLAISSSKSKSVEDLSAAAAAAAADSALESSSESVS